MEDVGSMFYKPTSQNHGYLSVLRAQIQFGLPALPPDLNNPHFEIGDYWRTTYFPGGKTVCIIVIEIDGEGSGKKTVSGPPPHEPDDAPQTITIARYKSIFIVQVR